MFSITEWGLFCSHPLILSPSLTPTSSTSYSGASASSQRAAWQWARRRVMKRTAGKRTSCPTRPQLSTWFHNAHWFVQFNTRVLGPAGPDVPALHLQNIPETKAQKRHVLPSVNPPSLVPELSSGNMVVLKKFTPLNSSVPVPSSPVRNITVRNSEEHHPNLPPHFKDM